MQQRAIDDHFIERLFDSADLRRRVEQQADRSRAAKQHDSLAKLLPR
jgi:hypothetical protein